MVEDEGVVDLAASDPAGGFEAFESALEGFVVGV